MEYWQQHHHCQPKWRTMVDGWLHLVQATLWRPTCVLCKAEGTARRDLCAPCERDLVPKANRSSPPAGFDPTDPRAYVRSQWQAIDEIVRGSTQRGMRVLLTPAGPIPNWASESGRSVRFPVLVAAGSVEL